jgi:hypothetical protein
MSQSTRSDDMHRSNAAGTEPTRLARAAPARWDDPPLRERYLDAVRWIERDRALIAVSAHTLRLIVSNKSAS